MGFANVDELNVQFLKALVNVADTLLPMMFLGLHKLENICCGHKMFLNKIRNIFCARGQTGKHSCRQQCVRCPQLGAFHLTKNPGLNFRNFRMLNGTVFSTRPN